MVNARFEANRARIVQISAELFARNGYHATGVAELSAATSLGRGALYHYIGNKEALLYAICKSQLDRMNQFADELTLQPRSAQDRLRLLARALMRNIAEHRAEWAVFFREYSALTGPGRDHVIAAREHYESHWRQTLEQGVREGTFTVTPSLLVKGILGMFNYTYLWFDRDGAVSPEQLADEFLDAILHGIVRR
jgi:AcrR family transcriptional regulator